MTPEDARHHARAWALARKSILCREKHGPEEGAAMYAVVGAEAGYEALAKELDKEETESELADIISGRTVAEAGG